MRDESTRSRVAAVLAGEGAIIHALVALVAACGLATLVTVGVMISQALG